ncbi:hypothetical protein apy_16210 [Aeropyrum pernix]|uniref:Uncharacterized protein n=1 Tax=Aeropyrum pernix TaxID=56636 RepID=A0A401HBS1_AERPX|nr:hypothetical protein [Aeropyrum pernix]GBF09896.1 hypothetical protein apy_16210 [Aeropyrum pernix]
MNGNRLSPVKLAILAAIVLAAVSSYTALAESVNIIPEDDYQSGLVEVVIEGLDTGVSYTIAVEGGAVIVAVAGDVNVASYSENSVELVTGDGLATVYAYAREPRVYTVSLYSGGEKVAQASFEIQQLAGESDPPPDIVVDDYLELAISTSLLTGSPPPSGVEILAPFIPSSDTEAVVYVTDSITVNDRVSISVDTNKTGEYGVDALLLVGASGGVPGEKVDITVQQGAVLGFKASGDSGFVVKLSSFNLTLDGVLEVRLGGLTGLELEHLTIKDASRGHVELFLPSYSSLGDALATGNYISLHDVEGFINIVQVNSDPGKILAVRLDLSGPPWPGLELVSRHHNVPLYIVEGPASQMEFLRIRGIGVLALEPGSILKLTLPLEVVLEGSYFVKQLPLAAVTVASTYPTEDLPLLIAPSVEVSSKTVSGGYFAIAGIWLEAEDMSIGNEGSLYLTALSYAKLDVETVSINSSTTIIGRPPEGILPVTPPEADTILDSGDIKVEAEEIIAQDAILKAEDIEFVAGSEGITIGGVLAEAQNLSLKSNGDAASATVSASSLLVANIILSNNIEAVFSTTILTSPMETRISLGRNTSLTTYSLLTHSPLIVSGSTNGSSTFTGTASVSTKLGLFNLNTPDLTIYVSSGVLELEAYKTHGSITIMREGRASIELNTADSQLSLLIAIWGGSITLEDSSFKKLTVKTTRDDLTIFMKGVVRIYEEASFEVSYWSKLHIKGVDGELSSPSLTMSAPEGEITLDDTLISDVNNFRVDESEAIPYRFETSNVTVEGGSNSAITVKSVETVISSTTINATVITVLSETASIEGSSIQGRTLIIQASNGLVFQDNTLKGEVNTVLSSQAGSIEVKKLTVEGCSQITLEAVEGYLEFSASCGGQSTLAIQFDGGLYTLIGEAEGEVEVSLSNGAHLTTSVLEVKGGGLRIVGGEDTAVEGSVSLVVECIAKASATLLVVSGLTADLNIVVQGVMEPICVDLVASPHGGSISLSSLEDLSLNIISLSNVSLTLLSEGAISVALPQNDVPPYSPELNMASSGPLEVTGGNVNVHSLTLEGKSVVVNRAHANASSIVISGEDVYIEYSEFIVERLNISTNRLYVSNSNIAVEKLDILGDITHSADPGLSVILNTRVSGLQGGPGFELELLGSHNVLIVRSELLPSAIIQKEAASSTIAFASSKVATENLEVSASSESGLSIIAIASQIDINGMLSISSKGMKLSLLSSSFQAGECSLEEGSDIISVDSRVNAGCRVTKLIEEAVAHAWGAIAGDLNVGYESGAAVKVEGIDTIIYYTALEDNTIYVTLVPEPGEALVLTASIATIDCSDKLLVDELGGTLLTVAQAVEEGGECMLRFTTALSGRNTWLISLKDIKPDSVETTTVTETLTTTLTTTETEYQTYTLVETETSTSIIYSTLTETVKETVISTSTIKTPVVSSITITTTETITSPASQNYLWMAAGLILAILAASAGYVVLRRLFSAS